MTSTDIFRPLEDPAVETSTLTRTSACSYRQQTDLENQELFKDILSFRKQGHQLRKFPSDPSVEHALQNGSKAMTSEGRVFDMEYANVAFHGLSTRHLYGDSISLPGGCDGNYLRHSQSGQAPDYLPISLGYVPIHQDNIEVSQPDNDESSSLQIPSTMNTDFVGMFPKCRRQEHFEKNMECKESELCTHQESVLTNVRVQLPEANEENSVQVTVSKASDFSLGNYGGVPAIVNKESANVVDAGSLIGQDTAYSSGGKLEISVEFHEQGGDQAESRNAQLLSSCLENKSVHCTKDLPHLGESAMLDPPTEVVSSSWQSASSSFRNEMLASGTFSIETVASGDSVTESNGGATNGDDDIANDGESHQQIVTSQILNDPNVKVESAEKQTAPPKSSEVWITVKIMMYSKWQILPPQFPPEMSQTPAVRGHS